MCADNITDFIKNTGQPLGVILFVDILNIGDTIFYCFGVANIVHIKTERFGKIIEAVKLHFFSRISNVHSLSPSNLSKMMAAAERTERWL